MAMATILLKVKDKIKEELEDIKDEEGLNNQTSTFIFLIKYYKLTKKSKLDNTVEALNKVLDKMDVDNLPPLEEQLKDV